MPTFSTLDEALSAVETRFLNNLPREELDQVGVMEDCVVKCVAHTRCLALIFMYEL
jgi:hypothetical protein